VSEPKRMIDAEADALACDCDCPSSIKAWQEMYRAREAEEALTATLARSRAREKRLEEALRGLEHEADGWDHGDDCARKDECDWAGDCDGDMKDCPTGAHRWCEWHGHDDCEPCDCGRGVILRACATVLSEET
jgi:hypothetical protein